MTVSYYQTKFDLNICKANKVKDIYLHLIRSWSCGNHLDQVNQDGSLKLGQSFVRNFANTQSNVNTHTHRQLDYCPLFLDLRFIFGYLFRLLMCDGGRGRLWRMLLIASCYNKNQGVGDQSDCRPRSSAPSVSSRLLLDPNRRGQEVEISPLSHRSSLLLTCHTVSLLKFGFYFCQKWRNGHTSKDINTTTNSVLTLCHLLCQRVLTFCKTEMFKKKKNN